jgi:hypothetical protein
MALFDVSDLEEAAVLGTAGGTVGALSPRVEGLAKAPPASRLDSRGECGGDVVGEGTGSGDEGFKTRPENFNYDGDTHGAKSRSASLGFSNENGVCADRFLLLDVTGLSANSTGCTDFGGE